MAVALRRPRLRRRLVRYGTDTDVLAPDVPTQEHHGFCSCVPWSLAGPLCTSAEYTEEVRRSGVHRQKERVSQGMCVVGRYSRSQETRRESCAPGGSGLLATRSTVHLWCRTTLHKPLRSSNCHTFSSPSSLGNTSVFLPPSSYVRLAHRSTVGPGKG